MSDTWRFVILLDVLSSSCQAPESGGLSMKTILLTAVLLLAFPAFSQTGQTLEYKSGSATMEGYLAVPNTKRASHPAVLIVHDWMGLGDDVRQKADEMAAKGYIALAVDVYGKGQRPKNQNEAAEFAGKYKKDLKLFRERMNAALRALQNQRGVSKDQIVAFGYCFGGTAVLELARSGAAVKGVASFHGNLSTPQPADGKKIRGKVIAFHGAIDPYVPAEEVASFQKEMNDAKIDYELIAYGGAVHSFTNPKAGNDPSKGAAYNKLAAERSWKSFERFLDETIPL